MPAYSVADDGWASGEWTMASYALEGLRGGAPAENVAFTDEAEALKQALRAYRTGAYTSVRLVKTERDPDTGRSRQSTIFDTSKLVEERPEEPEEKTGIVLLATVIGAAIAVGVIVALGFALFTR
jgi:hypothetical protein